MSRPDFGLLRNFLTVNRLTPNLNDFSDPNVTRDENGRAIAYDWQYTGQSGNPGLKPMTADQFDLTLAYSFGRSSSFPATGFYKPIYAYLQAGQFNLKLTNHEGNAAARMSVL